MHSVTVVTFACSVVADVGGSSGNVESGDIGQVVIAAVATI